MNMHSNRNHAQEYCENLIGANTLEDWKLGQKHFEAIVLSQEQSDKLKFALNEDCQCFYFKGLISLTEGICSAKRHGYSWATVKLYYSVYYLLRCLFCIDQYAIIRNKSLYLLKATTGSSAVKKSNKKYNSTHEGTIHYFIDTHKDSDLLQSNSIEGLCPYLWLMDKREHINYRVSAFLDPECYDFWQAIHERTSTDKFNRTISEYISDRSFTYCFQEDHAILAFPIALAVRARQILINNTISIIPEKGQLDYLDTSFQNCGIDGSFCFLYQ
jgi:hypothetical protein